MTRRNLFTTAIAAMAALWGWKPAKPVMLESWCERRGGDYVCAGGQLHWVPAPSIPIVEFTFSDGTKRRFEGDDWMSSEVDRLWRQMEGAA